MLINMFADLIIDVALTVTDISLALKGELETFKLRNKIKLT